MVKYTIAAQKFTKIKDHSQLALLQENGLRKFTDHSLQKRKNNFLKSCCDFLTFDFLTLQLINYLCSLKINTICNFQSKKSSEEKNWAS